MRFLAKFYLVLLYMLNLTLPFQIFPESGLPEREDFTHNVVFKEFHAGENIEHGGLLHPLAQREKFGWDNLTLGTSSTFFLDDMDHTLG